MDFGVQPRTGAAARDRPEVPRERVHIRASCGRGWKSPRASPTTSGPSWPSRDGSASSTPRSTGGAGLGFVDLTVLMEEMGRVVMPGAVLPRCSSAVWRSCEAGSAAQKKEWLTRIAYGRAKTALAWTEPSARWDAAGVHVRRARRRTDGFVLNGTKLFVLDAHLADVLVVVARTSEGRRPEDGMSLPAGAEGHARASR